MTLNEFKLTTLPGFVPVPFELWNKTTFLAERVLGGVVPAGVKILFLAVIVGIGDGLFAQLTPADGVDPTMNNALAAMTGIYLIVAARQLNLLKNSAATPKSK